MKLARVPRPPPDLDERALALLELRAARLRSRTTDEDVDELSAAAFAVGDRVVAIPLEHVRAAVPLRAVTPVPLAPAHVVGVLRFRGNIVPVVSLSAVLGVRGWRVDPTVLLVLDGGDGLVAIDCEEIPRAASLPRAAALAAQQQPTSLTPIDVEGRRVWFLPDPAALVQRGPNAG